MGGSRFLSRGVTGTLPSTGHAHFCLLPQPPVMWGSREPEAQHAEVTHLRPHGQ